MRLFFIIFFLLLMFQCNQSQRSVAQETSTQKIALPDTSKLSLLFIGDIMQHSPQIAAAYDPVEDTYNYEPVFKYVAPIFKGVDLSIGNLELTLAGPPYKGYPQFSAPDALAVALKNAGMDILVTANNHSCDRYKKGIERTISILDSLEIKHTGTFLNKKKRDETYPLIINKNDIRIALLNYTYGTNGIPIPDSTVVNLISYETIKKDLATAKSKKPDFVIVFMHWGDEYHRLPNESQKEIASLCIQNGADLIIGSHPHVIQPMERVSHPEKNKEVIVAYSLGNFVSNQRKRYRDGGAMLQVELKKTVKDSTDTTWIGDVGYHLAWVQKTEDSRSKYFVIPTSEYQKNTKVISSIKDENLLKTFIKDSETLLIGNNKNISAYQYDFVTHKYVLNKKEETQNVSLGSSNTENPKYTYKVQLAASKTPLKLQKLGAQMRSKLTTEKTPSGYIRYLLGPFSTRAEAQEYLKKLMNLTHYKDAFIVGYEDGKRLMR